MARVSMYVDGFNLYHAIKDLGRPYLKWLGLKALANTYLEKADTLIGVTYFTALQTKDPGKYQRHMAYIDALGATGVEVIRSKFIKGKKYCTAYDRSCKFDFEKQTDVAIAVRVLADVYAGIVDKVLLLTADSDQIPLVRHIRDQFPKVSVEIAAPPGRMQEARELCAAAHTFREAKPGRLQSCLLPRNVIGDDGQIAAVCPSAYLPN